MAAVISATNGLGWQLQKLTLWAQESIERLFLHGNASASPPPPQLPAWLLQMLFWLLALGAIGWLGWQLYQILRPYWDSLRPQVRAAREPAQTTANWLRQAQVAQAQADYASACRALYMATLQKLSERDLIAPQSSRTDGEYLALLQALSLQDLPRPQPYELLIQTHERLHFDRLSASAELYAQCWQAYQQLEQQATPGGSA